MKKRIIFFLIDGLADKPEKYTPLSAARKPFFTQICQTTNVFLSYIYPLSRENWPKEGEYSVSGLANLSILGYKIKPENFQRGPYEALGALLPYKNGWLAFRANFATVNEDLIVLDRRCGRNTFGLDILEKEINRIKFPIKFVFIRTTGHRGALVFKKRLSPYISNNDPYKIGVKVKKIVPLSQNKKSEETAKILNEFLNEVHRILDNHLINKKRAEMNIPKANMLLLREPGVRIIKLKNFFQKYKIKNGIVLATKGVDLGTCISVGFKPIVLQESKNIDEEFKNVLRAMKNLNASTDLIYIHLKKADEASHDKNFEKKKEFFEKLDEFMKKIYNKNTIFVITGDHLTSVKTGKHHFGKVPLLILNSSLKNQPKEFNEIYASKQKFIFRENSNLWEFLSNDIRKT